MAVAIPKIMAMNVTMAVADKKCLWPTLNLNHAVVVAVEDGLQMPGTISKRRTRGDTPERK